MQEELNQFESLAGIPVQKTEISNPTKTPWKNMLKKKPQKVFPGQTAVAPFLHFAFAITKRDLPIAVGVFCAVFVFRTKQDKPDSPVDQNVGLLIY